MWLYSIKNITKWHFFLLPEQFLQKPSDGANLHYAIRTQVHMRENTELTALDTRALRPLHKEANAMTSWALQKHMGQTHRRIGGQLKQLSQSWN